MADMEERNIGELLQIRRDKLAELQAAGRDPFTITRYDVTHHSTEIKEQYDALEGKSVSVAGRLMSKRIMGKASFCNLQDLKGSIQCYVARDDVGEEAYKDFKKMDIGDIVGLILTALLSVGSDGGNLVWLLLINTLIGCFAGWFGSSMMLARTVKVFRKPRLWLGFGVFAAVLTGFILGLRFDILGWQRRVPETNEIASVEISTGESGIVLGDFKIPDDTVRLTDPADFETVRTIHRHALKNRDGYFDGSTYYSDGMNESIQIRYHLKNGRTLDRVYQVTRPQDAERIGAIYSRPEVAEPYYEKLVPDHIFRATISGDVYYKDDDYSDHELVCTDPAGLKAAILADAAAGRLPVVNNFTRGTAGAAVFQLKITRMETENPETAYGLMLERIDIFETATQTLSLFEERVPD